ncbi:MAG: hypothetical protein HN576_05145 [Bacteriovoracaceae bacterium]|jgi:hypothetical protein|nr:hypothetical protein [Bacteriovoracaceae bacterium]
MRFFKYIYLVITLLFTSSCSSINKSHMHSGIDITIRNEMKAQIDVDMTTKLTGYAYGGYLFNLLKINGDGKYSDGISYNGTNPGFLAVISKVESVKAAAAYNAIRQSKADVLISPQYVIEESHWNPFWKSIKVKVTGYAGKVVSIK